MSALVMTPFHTDVAQKCVGPDVFTAGSSWTTMGGNTCQLDPSLREK
jgi:hypothetical protein